MSLENVRKKRRQPPAALILSRLVLDQSGFSRREEVPAAYSGPAEERTDQFTGLAETPIPPTQGPAEGGPNLETLVFSPIPAVPADGFTRLSASSVSTGAERESDDPEEGEAGVADPAEGVSAADAGGGGGQPAAEAEAVL